MGRRVHGGSGPGGTCGKSSWHELCRRQRVNGRRATWGGGGRLLRSWLLPHPVDFLFPLVTQVAPAHGNPT